MYRVGNKFKFRGYTFIIAHIMGNKVSLIDTETGRRWNSPVEVGKLTQITQPELVEIMGQWIEQFVGVDNNLNREITFEEMEEGKAYKLAGRHSIGEYIKLDGKLFCLTRSVANEKDRFNPVN